MSANANVTSHDGLFSTGSVRACYVESRSVWLRKGLTSSCLRGNRWHSACPVPAEARDATGGCMTHVTCPAKGVSRCRKSRIALLC